MASWLYPISTRPRNGVINEFTLADGTGFKTSITNFSKLVHDGRIQEDAWWHISQNFDRVSKNDEIFIYTGEKDFGIIGYATVLELEGFNQKTWKLKLAFDIDRCKTLINQQPVKAEIIRSWFNPRNAVRSLDNYATELNQLLPWEQGNTVENKLVDYIESEISATGQGYNYSQAIRKAVENHAMKRATLHYQSLGYQIKDVSLNSSYDLHCSNGNCRLLVEVKGTQSKGRTVFLTKNEVSNARANKGNVSLYVLHSILIDEQGEASGGTELILNPWDVELGTLKPLVYEYVIPTE